MMEMFIHIDIRAVSNTPSSTKQRPNSLWLFLADAGHCQSDTGIPDLPAVIRCWDPR